MTDISYPLPSLKGLPFTLAMGGLAGFVLGNITQSNPLMTVIFLIREAANTIFFRLASVFFDEDGLHSQKIFIITSSIVNMTFLFALRELDLIGQLFSWLLGLGAIGILINRVKYIQKQESAIN
jgi:hypothetical protein